MSKGAANRFRLSVLTRLAVAAVLFVAGCTVQPAAAPAERAADADRPATTITVFLAESDTRGSIAEKFGGDVLVWHGPGDVTSEPTDAGTDYLPFAVLTVTEPLTSLRTAAACPEQPVPGDTCVEQNSPGLLAGADQSHIWGSGRSNHFDTVVIEGRSSLWNEGRSSLWNEGNVFVGLPENTDLWRRTNLRMAQDGSMAGQRLGDGIVVAVIDTGIDLEHPWLVPALTDPSTWLDLVDGDTWPMEHGSFTDQATPAYGHGTAIAGVIRQIAPAAQIMPIRVLYPDGHGYVSDVVAAIAHAIEHGADVINLSLGGRVRSEALNQVLGLATQQGIHVVMSAGNTGLLPAARDRGQVTWPGQDSNDVHIPGHHYRLTVTSVGSGDLKSDFAAHGPAVGLAAPGELVWSFAPDDQLAAWSGTSLAAPMAAGALALALAEDAAGLLAAQPRDLVGILARSGSQLYADGANSDYREGSLLGYSRLDFWEFLHAVLEQNSDE